MTVQISINDQALFVEKGISILQAARLNGIDIPTLCDYPGLPPSGSCRLCVVEVEGKPTTPTACTTPVEEGMVIQTHSEKIRALRSELLQMLLAEHPACCFFCPDQSNCDDCMVTLRKAGVTTGCHSCPKDGQCQLQDMVEKIGLPQPGYPVRYRMLKTEKDDPFFDRDYNLCVLCGRCIRTCEQTHFSNILVYTRRGAEVVVGTAFHRTNLEAGCSFCGSCVEACPTGALSEKTRKWGGKPDTETVTTCPLCSVGCQMRLLSRDNQVIGSLPEHSSGLGVLCVEGRFAFAELLNHPDRLTKPQKTTDGHQLKIEWQAAIHMAVDKIAALSPDRVQMIVSTDLNNEDLYIAHKFSVRATGITPKISSVHPYSAEEWTHFLSLLKRSQPVSVLEDAGAILCLGFDGRYAQSVAEVAIHRARIKGASLVTVHPFEHSLGPYADVWLRPQAGSPTQQMIQTLSGRVSESGPIELSSAAASRDPQLDRAAQLLRGASRPAILLGSDFLLHLDMRAFLPVIDDLLDSTGASLVLLPQESNLAGALWIASLFTPRVPQSVPGKLLYLIGVDIPVDLPGSTEIIYQNIFHPSDETAALLQLPAAAFSETSGTAVNQANQLISRNQSVKPPDDALPNWEILCRIARQMGLEGFDFTSAADIRAEIETLVPGFKLKNSIPWTKASTLNSIFSQMIINPAQAHTYLGQPLHWRVAGMNDLIAMKNSSQWAAYVRHS